WAVDETQPVDLSAHLPNDWPTTASGPWQLFQAPGVQLPDAGWKIHVSMIPADAPRVLGEVARTCVRHRACFKTLRGSRLIRASHLKYTPASISGKVATVYATSAAAAAAVAEDLAQSLRGVAAPTFPGETNHPDAPLGIRWGSFVENWIEAPDGRSVPGLRDETDTEADDRAARRRLPPELERVFGTASGGSQLPITDASVLHRSNAGGVYLATLRTGDTVVLKEARHHTGLDADGVDAVTRLRHERNVLERLAGREIAPEPLDYWEGDDADFLVMEALDGPSLVKVIGRDHPRGRPAATRKDRSDFAAWAVRVMANVRSAIETMHEAGVSHGDIQPGNIVVLPGGIRLVDFESARLDDTAVSVSLGTPGFICDSEDPADRDTFAVERIELLLGDPDALLLDRRPDLQPLIESTDAPPAVAECSRNEWIARLSTDLVTRATPWRGDRLFPGGIEQFTVPIGAHNLLSGAAGVLLTLDHLGHTVDPLHVDWLADLPDTALACRGFAEGIDGIAMALARLGRTGQADRIAGRLVNADPPQGLSWARGRAGVAVGLAELAVLLDRDDLRDAAAEVCTSVVRDIDDPQEAVPGPGLLHGWAGVALALMRVADVLGCDVRGAARRAIERELELLEPRDDCLIATAGGRLRSGPGHGSGATVLAISALGTDDDRLCRLQRQAGRATEQMTATLGGFLDGVAGDAVVLDALGKRRRADERRNRATWYGVRTHSGWSTLGAQRLRCSDDVGSGTSGLLLALSADPTAGLTAVLSLPESGR
ncbi:MAG: hypothetical protein L0K86_01275, partial [Actinomycetia bacterium]|nr:hypothetical protein [Actinomycetes bacterium]